MWSFIRIPYIPGQDREGVVSLKQYLVAEGETIKIGQPIATARTVDTRVPFQIVSNYDGRVLKLILHEGAFVAYRDPIATMELLSDPIDGRLIETCELV